MIRDVHDPEKPETLEELNVVSEEGVKVTRLPAGQTLVTIQFVPTVPHCSLASIIGELVTPGNHHNYQKQVHVTGMNTKSLPVSVSVTC